MRTSSSCLRCSEEVISLISGTNLQKQQMPKLEDLVPFFVFVASTVAGRFPESNQEEEGQMGESVKE